MSLKFFDENYKDKKSRLKAVPTTCFQILTLNVLQQLLPLFLQIDYQVSFFENKLLIRILHPLD